MRQTTPDENAPGLGMGATPAEIDVWMQVDPPGIRTRCYPIQKLAVIKYDLPGQKLDDITILGMTTIIGRPYIWIFILIRWFREKGYESIFVEPFDFPSAQSMKPIEVFPGLFHGYTDGDFLKWMMKNPVPPLLGEHFCTRVSEETKTIVITFRRLGLHPGEKLCLVPWPWVYMRIAYHERSGYKVILNADTK
jgi:hypothetical protein